MKQDIKEFSLEELANFLSDNNFKRFYADEVFRWIYKKRIEDFFKMTNISKDGQVFLDKNFYFSSISLIKREISKDKTEKFLFGLNDKEAIETVLIRERDRLTLCVSSQVGCKFNCKFCTSGKSGFKRNLSVSEIVNQYLATEKIIYPEKITNIVFMGIGEPLDNFSNVLKAINIFINPKGIYLGRKKICISTCGIIPKIKELIDLNLDVKLSVSLHSPFQDIRSQIMPINKKYQLKELIEVSREFSNKKKLPITFEYILISNLNTRKEDAKELAFLLKNINYKINLIFYNDDFSNSFKAPSQGEVKNFTDELKKRNIFYTLRKPKGKDINAACGQLRAIFS